MKQNWKKIFIIHISDKELIIRIKNSYDLITQITQFLKMADTSQKKPGMISNHQKGCSTSMVTGERQNKTKMRCTTHLLEWLKFNFKKINTTKYWQRNRTMGLLQIARNSVTQYILENTLSVEHSLTR